MGGQGVMTALTRGFLPCKQGLALRVGLGVASGTRYRFVCPDERKACGVMVEGLLRFGPPLRGVAGFATGDTGLVLKLCAVRIIIGMALRTGQIGEGKYASSWRLIVGAVGPGLCIGTVTLLAGNEHVSSV